MKEKKNIIWSNLGIDYDEWKDDYKEYCEDNDIEYDENNIYEWVDETLSIYIEDERCNLNKKVDGVIVGFASLGLWNGRVNGAKSFGNNISDILYSEDCDYAEWYCDRYNDGRNYILYRVAKNADEAKKLVNDIAYHDMTEEQFRKRTRSLRPYIQKVYGFK